MFDLEHAIQEWRRELTTGGIKSSSTLDELENHLREDIERQMRSGLTEQPAFEAAVRCLGKAHLLKPEFIRANRVFGILGRRKSTEADHILGVLWLMGCSWSLASTARWFLTGNQTAEPLVSALSLLNWLVASIYAMGIIGSVCLFLGENCGRRIIRTLALFMTVVCVAQVLNFGMPAGWRVWCGVCALFSLVTIWLLHRPQNSRADSNAAAAQ